MGKHFSFIHCADLHLGEPFGGLYSGDTGPWTEAIHKATFKAFENVVTAALTYRADAILISGDVYNSDHHSLAAQMAFARELYRAAQAGCRYLLFMEIMILTRRGGQMCRCRLPFMYFLLTKWNQYRYWWVARRQLWFMVSVIKTVI